MKYSNILFLFILSPFILLAQKKAPDNWFNLDQKNDKVWGVSTEKVYKELKVGQHPNKIIVAVIDGGTDIAHEELKAKPWTNILENPNNGIDDDHNGFVDDINGWDFIGGRDQIVVEDTYEYTRILGSYLKEGDPENLAIDFPDPNTKAAKDYASAKIQYNKTNQSTKAQKAQFDALLNAMVNLSQKAGSSDPSVEDLKKLKTSDKMESMAKKLLIYVAKTGGKENSPVMKQIEEASKQLNTMANFNLNLKFNPRNIVGDDYSNPYEKYYGNNQIIGPKAEHGTHVAGIIGADRNNGKGIKGICQDSKIMVLRVVPDGDERDKDVANAIIYAADNGARVINMSFGKTLSPQKDAVDKAVKYAYGKDVLIIHAAGNDAKNIDEEPNYPSAKFEQVDYTAPNWIEVGASSWQKGKKKVASFSNYGKNTVDVFAPGEDIYSCIPENKYDSYSGTSMAAPVVAGVAALIRQNYPHLTAVQTKQIILLSAVKYEGKVYNPSTHKKTRLNELCSTGAIVNAYEAMILAEKVVKGEVKLPN